MNKTEFRELQRRRRSLMRLIGEDAMAIIPSAPEQTRSRDTTYRFRQDSDFHYLSGFDEPEALLVLLPGRRAGEFMVFCRESNPEEEIWHGRRLGVDNAPQALGADDAFPISDIEDILPGLIEGRQTIYYTMGKNQTFDAQVMRWVNEVRAKLRANAAAPKQLASLDFFLHEMRVIKSRSEISLLRKAAKISAAGHLAAMKRCRAGQMEYELESELVGVYRQHGATHAFLPIVGGGVNGCILHYTENNRMLNDGELVLVDSGAEFRSYAGDITRTYPVNGRFSDAQREIYQIVLEANKAAIEKVRPGNHWNDPHDAAVKVLARGLLKVGLLKGTLKSVLKNESYRKFYMHRTGHWLGLDVHDVGDYKIDDGWRLLEPGMVLTIEPGLYIGQGRGIPKRYANIGVRIEDDVLVTAKGCEVLTDSVPKQPDEIESLMHGGSDDA